jgi:hypothetical protein
VVVGQREAKPAVMLDQASLPWFAELNRSLNDTLDDAQFRAVCAIRPNASSCLRGR